MRKRIRSLVNRMIEESPQPPVKKEGVTVIEKNGKVYVYNYRRKKR